MISGPFLNLKMASRWQRKVVRFHSRYFFTCFSVPKPFLNFNNNNSNNKQKKTTTKKEKQNNKKQSKQKRIKCKKEKKDHQQCLVHLMALPI